VKSKSKSVFGRIYRRAGRPGFYLRVRINDRETTRYAGPDRKTAHEVLGRLLQVQRRQDLLGEKPVAAVTVDRIEADFKAFLEAKHAPETYDVECHRLADIVERFRGVPLRDVDAGMVTDYLTDLRATRGLSAATVNRYQCTLSLLFRFAVDRGAARANPVAGLPRVKEDLKAVGFISDADVDRLVACASDPAFAVLVRVLADTGLRRSEALALTWRDVDFRKGEVMVRRSKTHRPRSVPMTAAVAAALKAHHDAVQAIPLRGEDPVFPTLAKLDPSSVSARLTAVVRRAGLPAMRLHDLRHGFCSRLAQAGVPLPTVAALAGHRAIQTTMRYARHVPDGATRRAIDALSAGAAAPRQAAGQ